MMGWIEDDLDYRHNRKIDKPYLVITAMNTGQGPDLLGMCEIENLFRR
jgi:hypothetical protein